MAIVKHSFKQLKTKIKEIETYLGPRINYTSDKYPSNKVDRWLLEYSIFLKSDYYKRLERKRKS